MPCLCKAPSEIPGQSPRFSGLHPPAEFSRNGSEGLGHPTKTKYIISSMKISSIKCALTQGTRIYIVKIYFTLEVTSLPWKERRNWAPVHKDGMIVQWGWSLSCAMMTQVWSLTPHMIPVLPGLDPECRNRNNPWACLGVAPTPPHLHPSHIRRI